MAIYSFRLASEVLNMPQLIDLIVSDSLNSHLLQQKLNIILAARKNRYAGT